MGHIKAAARKSKDNWRKSTVTSKGALESKKSYEESAKEARCHAAKGRARCLWS